MDIGCSSYAKSTVCYESQSYLEPNPVDIGGYSSMKSTVCHDSNTKNQIL